MSLVATLKIKSHRDCLLHIPGDRKWRELLKTTSNNEVVVLELMWSNSQYTSRVLVSPAPTLLLNMKTPDEVQLDPNFAAAIGVKDKEQVHVQLFTRAVPHCKSVTIVPASSDDWAVCNQDKEFIMDHLQDQIRVMQGNLHFALFKGLSLLCPKLKVASVEPNAICALLVRDTVVEIVPSAPPSYGRSITSPAAAAVGDYNSSYGLATWISSIFNKTEPDNSNGRKQFDSGYTSGSGGSGEYSGNSGFGGGADSGFSDGTSELTSPVSATSTPSVSPPPWDFNPLNWLISQGPKIVPDVKGSTVDHLPVKRSSAMVEVPSASKSVKGNHKKQTSWPVVGRLLPKHIDTPPLNVILRVQPYSCTVESSWNDVEQLDAYVHPATFPTLYAHMCRYNSQESSNTGFLVKLQPVSFPEKPHKKSSKYEKDEDNVAAQLSSAQDKQIVTALLVRLCFVSSYHLSNNQESSADLVDIKPNHIVISDGVRRQMGIKDFSRVKLTEVTESMRISCNGHLIKLSPLNNKSGLAEKELRDTFQNWVQRVCIHSPFAVHLTSHVILSLQTKSGKLCDVEVRLVGLSKRKQNKDSGSKEADKEIDFIILEDRDITGNRVSLTVETEPVKSSSSSSSEKSSKTKSSDDNKRIVELPEMSELREPLVREPLPPVGGIDGYINEGIRWTTNALEKQLAISRVVHGSNAGALLICGRSKSSANAGYGITTIAKTVCRRAVDYPLLAHIIVLECGDYRGRPTKVKEVLADKMMEARWYQPSILLLDDLDHIAPSFSNGHDHGSDVMNADRTAEIVRDVIVEEMYRGSSIVFMATAQSVSSLHPKLLPSRGNHLFRKIIEVSSPNLVTRQEILKVIVKSKGFSTDLSLDWKELSSTMEGFVVRDLINVVERAIHNSDISSSHDDTLVVKRSDRSSSVVTVTSLNHKELHYKHFQKALESYRPVTLRSISLHMPEDICFDNVGGLVHIKTALVETIQWPAKFPRVHSSFTLKRSSGVLLFGAPGTGKTMIAKALSKQFGLNFINIKGPELLSKYIGASEQAVRDVFVRAHSAKPCILFFDEFDALAPQRGHDNTGVTDRVVNQLLTQMDGIETLEGVYVLVASNRPDLIDPALLRPGRIDVHLYCDLPNIKERVKILEALSKSLPLTEDVDFHTVACECEYFTGADLKALLYNAQLLVAHQIINRNSEKVNSGVAVNGITPVKKFWCSSNVGNSKETEEEITQKLKIIQRINSGKQHKTKKRQATVQEKLKITQSDILMAAKELQPSLSPKDRSHFLQLYDSFTNKTTPKEYMTQKATLA